MRRAFGEMLRSVGAPVQGSPLIDQSGRHWTFKAMYGGLGLEEAACAELVGHIDAAHAERHIWCGCDADAPRVVDELKRRGLLVGVVSNTEDGRVRDALEAAGLGGRFDVIVDSHLVGFSKPDPAIFRHALGLLKVEAHEAVFVGDSYAHDALGARAAGLAAVLLDPLDLHPEAVCPRIRALGDLLPREA
jgi:HAD superfamily hydrolase (TIGR01509 family)